MAVVSMMASYAIQAKNMGTVAKFLRFNIEHLTHRTGCSLAKVSFKISCQGFLHSELPRPIFQIRPRMYVRRTTMYEIAAF